MSKTNSTPITADSRCGLSCTACTYREPFACGGCIETEGHPFHGECPVAHCCQARGFAHCGECPDLPCALLSDYSCDPQHGDNPPGERIRVCRMWNDTHAVPVIPPARITALRIERQHLFSPVSGAEYDELFRDLQPGLNEYWHGFGFPPLLSYRASFDDTEYNRQRQLDRQLLKLRIGGGIGWILREDLGLYYALYRKPLDRPTRVQTEILDLLTREGPMTIQQIKEETSLLVKVITPALHRLQEAFLIYEDQNDGEWDRGWYLFSEMFPEFPEFPEFPDSAQTFPSRSDALKAVLRRFAYRTVLVYPEAAKAFYRLPEKEIRAACTSLCEDGIFTRYKDGYLLTEDAAFLKSYRETPQCSIFVLHRNDFLVRSAIPHIERTLKPLYDALPYDHEPLQYILIDGELRAAAVGHFRYGPYEIHDIVCTPDAAERKEEICEAVQRANPGAVIQRFGGVTL